MTGELAIAILAAGAGRRFGGTKLDQELAGKPLGRHALETVLALEMGKPRIVVCKPIPQFALDAMACDEAQILKNVRAGEGIGTSVALAAILASAADASALLLVAGDMPQVTSATLRKLVEAAARGHPAAVAYPDGSAGIPACFPADWFPKLVGLDGDRGAGALLREADGIVLVEARPEELTDVDTLEELESLKARHRL